MTIDASAFTFVSELVRAESAIVVGPGKEYLVESRLLPIARELGFGDAAALVSRFRQRPDQLLRQRIVEAMTTNETSFFRDREPFNALRDVIAPELVESRQRRGAARRLTVWSAACSTGQEAYSIAISLIDHPKISSDWQIDVVASDINREVLDRATTARYSQLEVNRGLPALSMVNYFERSGPGWSPTEKVRKLIRFKQLNLAEAFRELPVFDIVFLRNVLIYFDTPTKTDVLARVRETMAPDGYLFLGGAETTLGLDDGFDRVPVGSATAYRPRVEQGSISRVVGR